jgi:hypothetical protein
VLASLWERKADGGALIVFDAATFKEVKRIPMDKPVGKYNLYNKITPFRRHQPLSPAHANGCSDDYVDSAGPRANLTDISFG